MKTFICLILRGVVFLTFSLAPTFAQPSEPSGLAHRPAVLTNNVHYRRWAWAHERRKYPAQSIPTGALLRAWEETARIDAEQTLTEPAVLPGNAWVPVGPAPILNGQTSGSQPVSGRIADLAIDPTDNAHWLAGGAQGGLWESRNAGLTWRPMTDNQASLSMGAVAFAPSDPSILFAGTGEQNIAADAYAGVGILKSTNGGTNWSLLGTANFGGAKFSEIKVHPTNPNLVLAAADSGVWKSTNGGTSWVLKRSGYASDLEPDPTSFTNLYCALGSAFGGGNNGVYRSTDLGETWSAVSGPWSTAAGGVGRIELAIAPSARGTLYVSIQDALDGSANDGRSLGLWRTDDAWNVAPSWTQLPAIATSSQLWYDHDVVVDPTNPNILYFGETNMRRFDGVAWVNITGTIHVDVQALAWAGNRLVLGSDGGVWSTTTGGASWSDHNTNLQLTQFYRGALSPNEPNFALGGSQDNGTARWFGTNGWRLVFGGDGAGCAIANATNWAVSFQGQEIRRTRNNGLSFEDANGGLAGNAPFIGHLRKAPHHDDIFLASLSVLNKCTNFFSGAAAAWSANAPDLGNSVTEFAFARSDASDRTYAYSAASQLRLTTDGGQTWKDLDPFGQVPARTVTGLAFNPTDANILYVCLSGFNENTPALPGHVFRTANALAASPTWAAATFPVNIPANAIAMDQSDPAVVYVGTDLG
ncbi:MAG TPA: hypothetical protein VNH84_02935, partial [Candidatus Saccharimonadales bacterium]|nr:hypothetical protein [Candidatus Saccharimonadales bacterium]